MESRSASSCGCSPEPGHVVTPTPLAAVASSGRPTLFERPTWSAASAAGMLLDPGGDELSVRRHSAEVTARCLGDLSRVLELLTDHERDRAILLAALTDALFDVARGEGPGAVDAGNSVANPAGRIDDLNRIAFQVARALRGEAPESVFLELFAAEARRRTFTRRALDELFAAARAVAREPRPADEATLDVRARQLGEALATALLGAEPPASLVDLAAGSIRLVRLQHLSVDLRSRSVTLPVSDLAEPIQYRSEEEIVQAIDRECNALHHLLLKGARAAGEVPLTFRRPVAFLLPIAIALLGLIEERPRVVARRVRHLGLWKLRVSFWRARWTPLS